jgi:hypothetical protein
MEWLQLRRSFDCRKAFHVTVANTDTTNNGLAITTPLAAGAFETAFTGGGRPRMRLTADTSDVMMEGTDTLGGSPGTIARAGETVARDGWFYARFGLDDVSAGNTACGLWQGGDGGPYGAITGTIDTGTKGVFFDIQAGQASVSVINLYYIDEANAESVAIALDTPVDDFDLVGEDFGLSSTVFEVAFHAVMNSHVDWYVNGQTGQFVITDQVNILGVQYSVPGLVIQTDGDTEQIVVIDQLFGVGGPTTGESR